MKVFELIQKLQPLDQNAEITIYDSYHLMPVPIGDIRPDFDNPEVLTILEAYET